MRIGDKHYQSIWLEEGTEAEIRFINQLLLPFRFETETLHSPEEARLAISTMKVRGAPLIGAMAAAGIFLAMYQVSAGRGNPARIKEYADTLVASRPTAVNLSRMVRRMLDRCLTGGRWDRQVNRARDEFLLILEEEKEACRMIGVHGLEILRQVYREKGRAVQVLTHCNAGWLACIDYGTATAPVYLAHEAGIPVHVWVDETRPRNQGARLTAWELGQAGIPHTVIVDNAGGHLMQRGMIDLVIVGSDRTTRNGDVANKIGTYLKALAARDNGIPFYVALPGSSLDPDIADGIRGIPIEERNGEEVRMMEGIRDGKIEQVRILPEDQPVKNPGFDITPARLVTGLITEKGICAARPEEIGRLFKKG